MERNLIEISFNQNNIKVFISKFAIFLYEFFVNLKFCKQFLETLKLVKYFSKNLVYYFYEKTHCAKLF